MRRTIQVVAFWLSLMVGVGGFAAFVHPQVVVAQDADGDGLPNEMDPDDDNDGMTDDGDPDPTTPYVPPADAEPTVPRVDPLSPIQDSDGDGVPNSQDPNDDYDPVVDEQDPEPAVTNPDPVVPEVPTEVPTAPAPTTVPVADSGEPSAPVQQSPRTDVTVASAPEVPVARTHDDVPVVTALPVTGAGSSVTMPLMVLAIVGTGLAGLVLRRADR